MKRTWFLPTYLKWCRTRLGAGDIWIEETLGIRLRIFVVLLIHQHFCWSNTPEILKNGPHITQSVKEFPSSLVFHVKSWRCIQEKCFLESSGWLEQNDFMSWQAGQFMLFHQPGIHPNTMTFHMLSCHLGWNRSEKFLHSWNIEIVC